MSKKIFLTRMHFILSVLITCGFIALATNSHAEAPQAPTTMVEDTDGELTANEFTVISPNGGITRRPCPYTCEMRGIPREHCKEWKGVDQSAKVPECYVHDLRLPSDAIKFGGGQ